MAQLLTTTVLCLLLLKETLSLSLQSRPAMDTTATFSPSASSSSSFVLSSTSRSSHSVPAVASTRRSFLVGATTAAAFLCPGVSKAVVTDETDTFADTWWSTKQTAAESTSSPPAQEESQQSQPSRRRLQQDTSSDDEVRVTVSKQELSRQGGTFGLELAEIEFRTNMRVYIKSVQSNSLADKLGIQKDWIVVSIHGKSTERTNAAGVAQILASAITDSSGDSIDFVFRDPSVFGDRLQNLSQQSQQQSSVTTQVAPAGDTTQRRQDGSVKPGFSATQQTEQKVTVSQLIAPQMCERGATTDDLLEISYIGRVVDTGAIFDGSAVKINDKGIPGRGDDVSIYFVLGKQPFGQFPPGWDVGLQGICVGERRRLILPPALAYGSLGLPRRGIPPDATLQYDVTLVSLNGLATPQ